MEQVGKLKLYSSEEVLDKHFGKVGTPRRDEFERSVASSVHAYELGEAIKKARLEQSTNFSIRKGLQHQYSYHKPCLPGPRCDYRNT